MCFIMDPGLWRSGYSSSAWDSRRVNSRCQEEASYLVAPTSASSSTVLASLAGDEVTSLERDHKTHFAYCGLTAGSWMTRGASTLKHQLVSDTGSTRRRKNGSQDYDKVLREQRHLNESDFSAALCLIYINKSYFCCSYTTHVWTCQIKIMESKERIKCVCFYFIFFLNNSLFCLRNSQLKLQPIAFSLFFLCLDKIVNNV